MRHKMKSNENRRAFRSSHDSVMEIFDVEGNFILGVGRLVNFSAVGACFSSSKVLARGERLRVRLRLLKEGVLEMAARVVWTAKKSNRTLYGIEFDSLKNPRQPIFREV